MDRTISTVPLLWEEWTVGIRGGPAILTLEAAHGSGWRKDPASRKFFSERKIIIDAINSSVESYGLSVSTAVDQMEMRRAGRSMYQLIRELKGERERAEGVGVAGPSQPRGERRRR